MHCPLLSNNRCINSCKFSINLPFLSLHLCELWVLIHCPFIQKKSDVHVWLYFVFCCSANNLSSSSGAWRYQLCHEKSWGKAEGPYYFHLDCFIPGVYPCGSHSFVNNVQPPEKKWSIRIYVVKHLKFWLPLSSQYLYGNDV